MQKLKSQLAKFEVSRLYTRNLLLNYITDKDVTTQAKIDILEFTFGTTDLITKKELEYWTWSVQQ